MTVTIHGKEYRTCNCVYRKWMGSYEGSTADPSCPECHGDGLVLDTFATAMAETADAIDAFIIAAEDAIKDKPNVWGGETVTIRVMETDASRKVGELMREGEERRARKRRGEA